MVLWMMAAILLFDGTMARRARSSGCEYNYHLLKSTLQRVQNDEDDDGYHFIQCHYRLPLVRFEWRSKGNNATCTSYTQL